MMGLSSGDDLDVHLHADGYAADLLCNGEPNSNSIDVAKHYYAYWSNALNKCWPHDTQQLYQPQMQDKISLSRNSMQGPFSAFLEIIFIGAHSDKSIQSQ